MHMQCNMIFWNVMEMVTEWITLSLHEPSLCNINFNFMSSYAVKNVCKIWLMLRCSVVTDSHLVVTTCKGCCPLTIQDGRLTHACATHIHQCIKITGYRNSTKPCSSQCQKDYLIDVYCRRDICKSAHTFFLAS